LFFICKLCTCRCLKQEKTICCKYGGASTTCTRASPGCCGGLWWLLWSRSSWHSWRCVAYI
jgi:hypothetical protein